MLFWLFTSRSHRRVGYDNASMGGAIQIGSNVASKIHIIHFFQDVKLVIMETGPMPERIGDAYVSGLQEDLRR